MSERAHYTAVAIVLHWAIAAAILFNLPLGFWMHEQAENGAAVFAAFQLHKSIGLTVLLLSLVRLGWRIANPPPPMPTEMPAWEKLVARATHWAFYALMIALPLSGWIFVSAGWNLHEDRSLAVPTSWFGLIDVPPLFGLPNASEGIREEVADISAEVHELFAFAAIGLAVLHVGAALKHHVIDRDGVLAQMVPGLRAPGASEPAPKNPGRLIVLGVGMAAIVLALAVAGLRVASFAGGDTVNERQVESIAPAEAPAVAEADAPAPEATPGAPAAWRVDPSASAITFAYVYADESGETRFEGRFTRWHADIRFDPDNLDASSADVRIELASAATGVAMHDSTLPSPAWFNSSAFPTARFRTESIRRRGDAYEARGELTIRDRTRNVTLPFTVTINGDRAVMAGEVTLDRRDFDVGDDAEGDDLISRDVRVSVRINATRAP